MTEIDVLTNPNNYKILIQIKKNRRLKRKTKYLNRYFEFVENINDAQSFPDLPTAEAMLQKVSRFSSNEARPRVIIKYSISAHEEIKNRTREA